MAGRRIVITIKVQGADKAARDLGLVSKKTKKLSLVQRALSQRFAAHVVAARLVSGAYTNLKRAMDFGVKSAIDFEFSMKKVQAITGTTGTELASLETVVRDLAAVSPRTATEVANTALAMAKLGLSAKEVEDALEGVIGLSVALDENVEEVGSTLVAVKNVFQKEASELTQISDQLFTSFANSALNLDKFATGFSFAGGAAKLAGVEFEELTALMGVLSNAGIRSSTIGTQLRSIFIEMSDSTSKFGKATGGLTIKQDGLVKVLEAAKVAIEGEGEAKRIFGKRALSVVDVLTRSIDKFKELRDTTRDSDGATKKAADTLKNTMAGALKKVSSAWVEVNVRMSEAYGPSVIAGLNKLAELILNLEGVSNKVKKVFDFVFTLGGLVDGDGKDFVTKRRKELAELTRVEAEGRKAAVLAGENAKLAALKTLSGASPTIVGSSFNMTADAEKAALAEMDKEALAAQVLARDIENLNFRFKEMNDTMALAEVGLGKLGMTRAAFAAEMRGLADDFLDKGKVEEALEAATIATQLEKEAVSAAKKNRDQEMKAAKTAEKALDKAVAKEKAQNEILKERKETLAEIEQEIIESSFAFQLATQSAESLGQALNTVVGGAIDELFQDSVDWGNLMQSVFKQVLADLASMAIKLLIVDSLLKAIKAAFFLTGAGAAAGPAAGATDIPIASTFAANGFDGVVNQPTNMVVGEAGPERVQVTPAAKTARGGGQGGLTVNINGDVYGEEKFTQAVNMAMQNIDRNYVGV